MVDFNSELLFGKKISIQNEIEKFIIKKDNLSVSIDKQNYAVTNVANDSMLSKTDQIFAIVGIIDTRSNSYLVCVNNAEFVGNILTSRIFKITEVKFY
jgi:hypothetical protein